MQYVHSCSLLFSIENETFGQKYSVMMILSHIINNIACCNFFLTKTNRSQGKFAAFLTSPPRDYSTLLEPIIQVIYRINLHYITYLVMILIAIGNSQQACGQTTPWQLGWIPIMQGVITFSSDSCTEPGVKAILSRLQFRQNKLIADTEQAGNGGRFQQDFSTLLEYKTTHAQD